MRNKTFVSKGRKRLLGATLLLSASAFVTLGACADDGVSGYVVPNEKTVEVGFEYTPDFELGAGVEATIVKLNVPLTSKAYLIEGSFTPDVTGEYTYIVRFRQATENGVSEKEETITVKAVDTTAPTISSIADKQVEIGEYTALADDIASVVATDNCAQNVSVYAESYVFNGVETLIEKDATSIKFDKVGEYTINFVAEDFSGNKAKSSYKVVTEDTVAPVISCHSTAIVWAKDGKVTVPKINVIDVANCTVTATVKDSAGNHVFHMVNTQGYDGPYWLGGGINFGFYTNTFKLKLNLAAPKANFYFYIIYWDDNDKRHEDPITVDWANGVDLGNGWYDYTVTIPNATNRVSSFEMWTCYFDIDDIRAIDTSK